MKFRLSSTVFTVFSINLLISQVTFAGSPSACIEFYAPSSKVSASSSGSSFQFWPPRENAVLGSNTSHIANLLVENSARQKHTGRAKVYTPEIIGRELFTPADAPQSDRLYFAHKMLLGDLIKTDVYADAVIKVLAEDNIDTPEKIRLFVDKFYRWAKFNQTESESFLARSAKEFATRLEEFVGDNADYKKIDEAMDKYELSVEDLIQLKSNLALFRENNDGNLKLSIMLPILEDAQLTTKLLEEALVRRNTPKNLAVIPGKSTEIAAASPKAELAWHWRSLRNLGKKVFHTGQYRFGKLSSDGIESLLLVAENIFKYSKTEFSTDPNFLKSIFVNKENPKAYTLTEIVTFIKKSPGYFFIASTNKNKGYSAIETHIRIQDFIKVLPQMKLDSTKLRAEDFFQLQDTLEKLKVLLVQTSKSFSEKSLTLDSNIADNVLISNIPRQNAIWEHAMILQVSELQNRYTEFYVKTKEREGSAYFSEKESELINKTRANSRIVEMFDSAGRTFSKIDPNQFVKLISEVKLTTEDVIYLMKNFYADRFTDNWSIKALYESAGLPLGGIVEPNQRATQTDLNTIFAARIAMSFDMQSQKIQLGQFEVIFDGLRLLGVTENYLGKAALSKFFKSVIGEHPTAYDSFTLELNSTEAYLASLKSLSFDHVLFLQQNFNLVVDAKKAVDMTSAIYKSKGTGTFTILNWIKGARLGSARELRQ